MGNKITLKDVSNLSSTEMEAALTSNFNEIETAADDFLSRTGKLPNQMEADLDMNGHTVTNLKEPSGSTDAATKEYVDNNTTDIKWKGDWAPSVTYVHNDVVSYLGSSYICTTDHTSSTTDTPVSSSYWDLIVSKGDKGDPGELVLSGTTSVSSNYTVTKASNASGLIEVNTSIGPVVLTVDDSSSDTWFFFYRVIAGSNGVTVKKASDGSTISTLSEGVVVCYGTSVSLVADEIPDGSITEAKLAAGAVTPAKIDSTSTYTVDSLEATTALTRGGNTIWGDDNFAARIAALTENTAPTGTESVACDDGKRITVSTLRNPSFTSGNLSCYTLVTTKTISVAHGLDTVPSRCDLKIVCISDDSTTGYLAGDEIYKFYVGSTFSRTLFADSTNITYNMENTKIALMKRDNSTYIAIDSTNANNFAVVIMAWE